MVEVNSDSVRYFEEQRYDRTMLAAVAAVMVMGLFVILTVGFGVFLFRPVKHPEDVPVEVPLIIAGVYGTLSALALVQLFFDRLRTTLTQDDFILKMSVSSFMSVRIAIADIESIEPIAGRDWLQYGGIGVRFFGWRKVAYLLNSSPAIRITCRNKKELVVGTQTLDKFYAALEMAMRNSAMRRGKDFAYSDGSASGHGEQSLYRLSGETSPSGSTTVSV